MLNEDDILEQFTKEKDILEIFNLIKGKKIIKTPHFYDRLLFRDLDEELIDKTLPQKEKIKLIDLRNIKQTLGTIFIMN